MLAYISFACALIIKMLFLRKFCIINVCVHDTDSKNK